MTRGNEGLSTGQGLMLGQSLTRQRRASAATIAAQPAGGFAKAAIQPTSQWRCGCGQPNLGRRERCEACDEQRPEDA